MKEEITGEYYQYDAVDICMIVIFFFFFFPIFGFGKGPNKII